MIFPTRAVFEIEDRLTALFHADGRGDAARGGVTQDVAAELRVDEDSDLILRYPHLDRSQKAAIDERFPAGDLHELILLRIDGRRTFEIVKRFRKAAPVVERLNEKGLIVSNGFHGSAEPPMRSRGVERGG